MISWVWLVMLIMALLVPSALIILGNKYIKKVPDDMNGSDGHKTAMARKNRDTWEFANHHDGKLMRITGWIMLALSVIVMLLAIGKSNQVVGNCCICLLLIQIVSVLVCFALTESALRKTFDENGKRK